ncbi:MAG: hypothetical protein JW849_02545 [Phycisphaerae bacterium]|nr:hypothetical protein [Phycisphaerae bacterium]
MRLVFLFLLAAAIASPGAATAQTTQPGARQSEDLVHSADFIRKKLDELLAAMSDVAALLEKTDPDTAKILRQTVMYAQQEDVVNKIDDVKRLLRRGLDQAAQAGQSEVIRDLTYMLRLLEGARSDLSEIDERAARLRAIRNRLATLLKRQAAEEVKTRDAAGKPLDDAEQKEITKNIHKTAERMKKPSDGKPMPGRASAAKAGRCSGKAGQCLCGNDATGANRRQNQTMDHLRDAIRSLDEEIEKLQRRSKAETLADISERLQKVLRKQKACTKQTRITYDARAKADPPYDRPAQQKLVELAGVEGELAEEVRAVRSLLKKEGTTVVFPAVLSDVRRDLTDVQKRLADFDPGPLTQATQEEIQRTLEELLEAVRKELSKGPGRGMGGGGGGQCKPPLIPPVAELRMLRMKQLRVNRTTRRLDKLAAAGELSVPRDQAEYDKLAGRQEQVLKLVREMRAKLKRENRDVNPIAQPEETP